MPDMPRYGLLYNRSKLEQRRAPFGLLLAFFSRHALTRALLATHTRRSTRVFAHTVIDKFQTSSLSPELAVHSGTGLYIVSTDNHRSTITIVVYSNLIL